MGRCIKGLEVVGGMNKVEKVGGTRGEGRGKRKYELSERRKERCESREEKWKGLSGSYLRRRTLRGRAGDIICGGGGRG